MNDFVSQEGHWVWETSGVPFAYTNWSTGQPDNDGNQDCMIINRSKKRWYDFNCAHTGMKPLCQIITPTMTTAVTTTVSATTPTTQTSSTGAGKLTCLD